MKLQTKAAWMMSASVLAMVAFAMPANAQTASATATVTPPTATPTAAVTATATTTAAAPTAPAAPIVGENQYGAIAVSPETMDFAISKNMKNQEAAEKEAVRKCAEENASKPTDCEAEIWFYDQCAALAMFRPASLEDDGWWDTAFADTSKEAEAEAMASCLEEGEGCKIVSSFCSN